MSRRSIIWTVLALTLLGGAGYAYLSPPFAADCKASVQTTAARAGRLANDATASLKKSKFFTTCSAALRKYDAQQKAPPEPVRAVRASVETPSPDPSQKQPHSAGQRIANGHAFAKHHSEFGFRTEAEMASHIDRVIANPSYVRKLIRGRTAYWDDATRSVVITDPGSADFGTAFKPNRGRTYFDNLR